MANQTYGQYWASDEVYNRVQRPPLTESRRHTQINVPSRYDEFAQSGVESQQLVETIKGNWKQYATTFEKVAHTALGVGKVAEVAVGAAVDAAQGITEGPFAFISLIPSVAIEAAVYKGIGFMQDMIKTNAANRGLERAGLSEHKENVLMGAANRSLSNIPVIKNLLN